MQYVRNCTMSTVPKTAAGSSPAPDGEFGWFLEKRDVRVANLGRYHHFTSKLFPSIFVRVAG